MGGTARAGHSYLPASHARSNPATPNSAVARGWYPHPAKDWQSQFHEAQLSRTANVVCMKWGTRYGPEWVNRLAAMVRRNTTWTVRFV